jgi:hypothetical protein
MLTYCELFGAYVENINPKIAFSIVVVDASHKCSISLSVKNFGIRFPTLGCFILKLDLLVCVLLHVPAE